MASKESTAVSTIPVFVACILCNVRGYCKNSMTPATSTYKIMEVEGVKCILEIQN